jgi:hypothetical protein
MGGRRWDILMIKSCMACNLKRPRSACTETSVGPWTTWQHVMNVLTRVAPVPFFERAEFFSRDMGRSWKVCLLHHFPSSLDIKYSDTCYKWGSSFPAHRSRVSTTRDFFFCFSFDFLRLSCDRAKIPQYEPKTSLNQVHFQERRTSRALNMLSCFENHP